MSNALNHRHPGQPGRLGMYFQTLMLSALGVGGVEATSVFYRAKWYPEAQAKFLGSWNPEGVPAVLFHSDPVSTAVISPTFSWLPLDRAALSCLCKLQLLAFVIPEVLLEY